MVQKCLAGVMAVAMLVGCATAQPTIDRGTVTNAAVWVEDQCESAEQDEETLTIAEGAHDVFLLPLVAPLVAISIPLIMVHGLVESIRTGSADGEKSADWVLGKIMPSFAGPKAMRGGYHSNVPLIATACGPPREK